MLRNEDMIEKAVPLEVYYRGPTKSATWTQGRMKDARYRRTEAQHEVASPALERSASLPLPTVAPHFEPDYGSKIEESAKFEMTGGRVRVDSSHFQSPMARKSSGVGILKKTGKKTPIHKTYTPGSQLRATLFCSWLNILLLAVPAGFVVNYLNMSPIAVFFVNFAAIFPLSSIFSVAMDELMLRTGFLGGILVYMSFGNIVLFVTSIFLLRSGQIDTLKTSLIGGILTINLFNTGIAFLMGGLRREAQFFNIEVAHMMSQLLFVTVTALILPTASSLISKTAVSVITKQSRGAAVILVIVYILYLTFEFVTHKTLFQVESMKVAMKPRKHRLADGAVLKGLAVAGGIGAAQGRANPIGYDYNTNDDLMQRDAWDRYAAELRDEEDEPQMHILVCIATLVIGTTILAFNTKFMTDSIESLTTTASVPRDFIGIVLLPILSNDLAAIQMAIRDKMDVALQAALGKSLQTTLLVTPFLVLLGWAMGKDDMNLLFDGFQVVALFASVLLIQNGILHGKSNWLLGATFVLTYVMIGIASWFQGT